jgi:hypothetical protein
MPANVTFHFVDQWGGAETSRSYHNTQALVADVLTDVAALAANFQAAIQGGLKNVNITFNDTTQAFVAEDPSNLDENASIKVRGNDGRLYDFDLPMPAQGLRLPGRQIDTANVVLTNVTDNFLVGGTWRLNLNNPTYITAIEGGILDK